MKKILVVEDAEPVRAQLVSILGENSDFEVTEAANATEGLKQLQETHFDVVVLDYHLPEMTGIDILRKLSEQGKSTNCPVVMLTSEAESPGTEVKSLNVVSWVIKPVFPERFKDLIEQVITFFESQLKKTP